MKQQLEQLKAELREFIELSKTITPGPWKATKSHNHVQGEEPTYDVIGPHSDWFFLELEQDAAFIARSRNISPAMAECLLVSIERLNDMPFDLADALETQILNTWEASK
jgi:hypothetical protein